MISVTEIEDLAQLEELLSAPDPRPLVVFKHSTRCHVSTIARRDIERFAAAAAPESARAAIVLVVERRDVSDTLARRLGVQHQSPQAIVVTAGRVSWVGSHEEVTAERLQRETTAAGPAA